MARVYNFSAGPSMLPEAVLTKAAAEMLDYEGSGQSVMEMSHRSKVYQSIIDKTEALLREIMNIPDNYKVLFLQGGASSQFAMVPMNLMTGSGKADYIITGQWAKKAAEEAKKSFSHTRPNGTTCFTALKEAGISYAKAGENLAGKIKTPKKVVKAWMDSPGHRKNIMDPAFSQIGVGYIESGSYWCQFFLG